LRQARPAEDALGVLISSAEDLGPPGRDEIYGHGLLRADTPISPAVEEFGTRDILGVVGR
jgi:hypothetical protein